MPKFNVFGYTTQKWRKTVEAANEDEAWQVAVDTWNESNVYGGDTDVVEVEKIEE